MPTRLHDLVFSEGERDFAGTSRWFAISNERLKQFGSILGEHCAPETPPVMLRDFLALSLAPAMLVDLIEVPGDAAIVNYGLERVRSRGVAARDQRVRGRFALQSRLPIAPGNYLLRFRVAFETETSDEPFLTADPLMAIARFGSALSDSPALRSC